MSKQFIVRLKSGGRVVANSQIITLRGLGTGTISASDFSDSTLQGSIITEANRGSATKTVAAPQWTLTAGNPSVAGGTALDFAWTTARATNGPVSWFAVLPNTNTRYSGQALFSTGAINNLPVPGLSGSFSIATKPLGVDSEFQITLWDGDLGTGTFLARSATCRVSKIDLKVTGKAEVKEGQQVFVTLTGAPNEVVTFSGETNGTVTLDAGGTHSFSLTTGVNLALGNFTWTFDGSITTNNPTYTVKIVPNYNLTVTGPLLVSFGEPIAVNITGAPDDVVTATAGSSSPIPLKLDTAGKLSGDINPNRDLAAGTYSWTLKGEKTTNTVTYTVEVRNYTLAVNGPATAKSGDAIPVTITGAPDETVTAIRYGVPSVSFNLDSTGSITNDISGGTAVPPGTYTWSLKGNKTTNSPVYTLTVTPSYSLKVEGPQTIVSGQPILVNLYGAPSEQVTFSGNTTGTRTLSSIGQDTFDITSGSTLAAGNYTWSFDGNATPNTLSLSVQVTPAYTLAVTGPSTVIEGQLANVTITGAPNEAITVTQVGKPPINFYLTNFGNITGDISNNGTISAGTYSWTLDGNQTPNSVNYTLIVTPAYTLTVTGPATEVSGQPLNVTISGAPNDTVTYVGPTTGTITLNSVGGGVANIAGATPIAAGNYSWTFSGTKTTTNQTYTVTITPAYALAVTGPATAVVNTAIWANISGAPNETVNWTGPTSGAVVLSGAGAANVADITGGTAITSGSKTWTFDGNKTPNVVNLTLNVAAAAPTITSFTFGAFDEASWVTTGNINLQKVEYSLGSVFDPGNKVADYSSTSTANSMGPILLGGALSFGTQATYRLTVAGPGGTAFQDLTHTTTRNTAPVLPTFTNGDFETTTPVTQAGAVVTIPGWKIYLESVRMNGFSTVLGNPTPNDPTPSPGSAPTPYGDSPTGTGDFSYQFVNDAPAGVGTKVLRLLSTNASTNVPYGILRGPYVISENSINAQAGDTVEFYWKAANGGDYFDVFAYLVNETTGATVTLLDANGNVTNWTKVTKVISAGEAGIYRFVFVSGSYDATGGQALGASLYLDNIKLVKA